MERRDASRFKTFSRRTLLLGGAQMAMLSALVGRMYYLQVIESDQYAVLADDNRISLHLLAPRRGRILDRYGTELANNRQNYRVIMVPEQAGDISRTLAKLGELIPLDDGQRVRIMREIERQRKFMPVSVADNLTWDEFARVNLQSPYLPGLQLDVGETRDYPYGETLAHVIGYVAAVSEQDVDDNDDPLLELPGFRVGKSGVERIYDMPLRGKAGDSRVEVNAVGRVVRELARQDGEPGNDLVLTIDADLQKFTADRLAREISACAVVLDVTNGEILAMSSVPSFDPNAFNVGVSPEYWKNLNSNDLKPLTNKVIAGQYAPGSCFKLMVATAGLTSGAITPDHHVSCNGQLALGNAVFHCWRKGGHGTIGLLNAIEQSCDVFFYDVARRTGIDAITETANKFGLGHTTGLDLPGERPGLMPTQAWKKKNFHEAWTPGDTVVAGIGQGYVTVTPLQLALMAARLANGGREITPHLTRPAVMSDDSPSITPQLASLKQLAIPASAITLVQTGMNMVVNGERGTAKAERIKEPGFFMAGKTGSAQTRRITKREREAGLKKQEALAWEERDNGLFVCFAPVGNPRYACAVVVEHGAHGAVAGAVARDIMLQCQKLDPARRGTRGQVASGAAPATPKPDRDG
ncbi:MAG TPA: penicillin-binding protein 2 [Stellaceae bacterium]|nr:penicillin-binding protein 2 [Stellaceae bacterium]